jgi:DnaJ domain
MSSDDPYRVLGVDRSWSLADIEYHYREQIREWHPDRHTSEGPDAIAEAEQRTRELTAAMSEVRERHGTFAMPGPSATTPGANRGGWMGTGTNPSDDWATGDGGDDFGINFGWTLPDEERRRNTSAPPQPCPICGDQFTSLNDYTAHLHMVHGTSPSELAGRRRKGRRQRGVQQPRLIPFLEWLSFAVLCVAVFVLLGWRASMPASEANQLTPFLGVAVIGALALAGRLLYNRFFEDKRGSRRVKF